MGFLDGLRPEELQCLLQYLKDQETLPGPLAAILFKVENYVLKRSAPKHVPSNLAGRAVASPSIDSNLPSSESVLQGTDELGSESREDVNMDEATSEEEQGESHSKARGLRVRRSSRSQGQSMNNGAGQKAREEVLGRKARKTKAGGKSLNLTGASTKKDPQLFEQHFEVAQYLLDNSWEGANKALPADAYQLVVELSQICHRFLHDATSDYPYHPVKIVIQLLELGSSSESEAAAIARLKAAFKADSLESLAMRCDIADENMALNCFFFMLNTIQFRCKVIGDCHKTNSAKRTVLNRIQYHGRCIEALAKYVLDGGKFCLLAAGGESPKAAEAKVLTVTALEATLYILAFLASSQLQSKIRHLNYDAILHIYSLLRCPDPQHPLGLLVINDIIPAVAKMRKSCRVKFGSMFNEALLFERGLLPFVDVGDVTKSDEFFDRITFNAFLMPRHRGHWNSCFIGEGLPVTITPLDLIDRAMLGASPVSFLSHSRPSYQASSEVSLQTTSNFARDPGSPLTEAADSDTEAAEEPEKPVSTFKRGNKSHKGPHSKEFTYKYTERESERTGEVQTPKSLEGKEKNPPSLTKHREEVSAKRSSAS